MLLTNHLLNYNIGILHYYIAKMNDYFSLDF